MKPLVQIITSFILLFFTFNLSAQELKKVELKGADNLTVIKKGAEEKRMLIGNVQFEHEGVLLFCDSAYFYDHKNKIEALGNIHIQQGDSVHVYGKKLEYDGNKKMAFIDKDVQLLDKDMLLTTNNIQYDVANKIAFYTTGGTIVNQENTLNSQIGYYFTNSKEFSFKTNVKLTNPNYTMTSDTLKYNTASGIAYFYGPTKIVSQTDYIYCEYGWYDTKKEISQFQQNAFIQTEAQQLKAETIFYNRKKSYGKAVKNIELKDTVQNFIITGNLAEFFQKKEMALVTHKPLLKKINKEGDTLLLSADTLKTIGKNNNRVFAAYRKVNFFQNDLQGHCDSLTYSLQDSLMKLHYKPILWTANNQLTAEFIKIKIANNQPQTLYMQTNAFIASQEDSTLFNQIRGKQITGNFNNNMLDNILVEGNTQTIYYLREDNGQIAALNKADASKMLMTIKDGKPSKITFYVKPDATLYPIDKVNPKDFLLKGFEWHDAIRPKNSKDITKIVE